MSVEPDSLTDYCLIQLFGRNFGAGLNEPSGYSEVKLGLSINIKEWIGHRYINHIEGSVPEWEREKDNIQVSYPIVLRFSSSYFHHTRKALVIIEEGTFQFYSTCRIPYYRCLAICYLSYSSSNIITSYVKKHVPSTFVLQSKEVVKYIPYSTIVACSNDTFKKCFEKIKRKIIKIIQQIKSTKNVLYVLCINICNPEKYRKCSIYIIMFKYLYVYITTKIPTFVPETYLLFNTTLLSKVKTLYCCFIQSIISHIPCWL
ncbi:hypothetical protein AGLY_006021 [Aphis glycines]|uniref:Uncharacterized protein n=1 Tax=Aphis glycines TaxID=307491 RepID=A0A6G0TTU7_APHGL|nr:hypothetical protein AGLY_006021 [Aphis glycines]